MHGRNRKWQVWFGAMALFVGMSTPLTEATADTQAQANSTQEMLAQYEHKAAQPPSMLLSAQADAMHANQSDPFAEGAWTFQAYASTTAGDKEGSITTANVGFGYYFVDGLSINFEPVLGYVQANFPGYGGHGFVGGFDLLFRWHFFGIDENRTTSIYLDGGAGFQLADVDFPSDSHHDFRLLVGLGFTVKVPNTENLHVMTGARYIHISNADTSDINDGLNAPR